MIIKRCEKCKETFTPKICNTCIAKEILEQVYTIKCPVCGTELPMLKEGNMNVWTCPNCKWYYKTVISKLKQKDVL